MRIERKEVYKRKEVWKEGRTYRSIVRKEGTYRNTEELNKSHTVIDNKSHFPH